MQLYLLNPLRFSNAGGLSGRMDAIDRWSICWQQLFSSRPHRISDNPERRCCSWRSCTELDTVYHRARASIELPARRHIVVEASRRTTAVGNTTQRCQSVRANTMSTTLPSSWSVDGLESTLGPAVDSLAVAAGGATDRVVSALSLVYPEQTHRTPAHNRSDEERASEHWRRSTKKRTWPSYAVRRTSLCGQSSCDGQNLWREKFRRRRNHTSASKRWARSCLSRLMRGPWYWLTNILHSDGGTGLTYVKLDRQIRSPSCVCVVRTWRRLVSVVEINGASTAHRRRWSAPSA